MTWASWDGGTRKPLVTTRPQWQAWRASLFHGSHPRSLECGKRHACIVGRSGTDDKVYCWGDDSTGQLGQTTSVSLGDDEDLSALTAVDFGSDDTVKRWQQGASTLALFSPTMRWCVGERIHRPVGKKLSDSGAGTLQVERGWILPTQPILF